MTIKRHKKHKPFAIGVLCFLCLFVAAEPIRIANAALSKSSMMPCCAGKADHCASGIKAKKAKKVGAETSSSSPAVKSASLEQPCHFECGACAAASTRQQKRERGIVEATVFQNVSLTPHSNYQIESFLFSSTENWPRINSRGPPARR